MNAQESSPEREDLQNLSNGSGDSNPPSGKPHQKLGTSNFVKLLGEEKSYYIDKTGLVEAFFGCKRSRVLVTGPRRFGKTINLIMLKHFFELQVKVEKGQKLSGETFWEKVQSTENYKLFHDHNLSITKNAYLMKTHFGRYPVISVSFKCTSQITSYDAAISFCKGAIGAAFQAHGYLATSAELSSWEKETYAKWCKEEWIVDNKIEVTMGLETLAEYVCQHFGRKVVLLVDDYDAVITQAMLWVESVTELKYIIQDCTSIITNAVKGDANEDWVAYAFITGISHIEGMGLSASNVDPFTFLDNHSFVPYYGLTVEEVKDLLEQTYKLDAQEIRVAENKFNGYYSQGGLKMYNIWSVLEFAGQHNRDEASYEWQDTGMIIGLNNAFRVPAIKNIIEMLLLKDKDVNIGRVIRCMTLRHILDLVRVIRKFDLENIRYPEPNLFLSFLLQQGYLSYVHEKPGHVKIPNEQIKKEIRHKLTSFNSTVVSADKKAALFCREFFMQISNGVGDDELFKRFHENLEMYIQQRARKWVSITEVNMRCEIYKLIMDLINLGFGFKVGCETDFLDREGKQQYIDYIIIKDSFVMIIEFKYNKSNQIAMDVIRERNYCDVFQRKEIVRNDVEHFVLLGVNMDDNRKVSIGYLQDSQQFDQATYLP